MFAFNFRLKGSPDKPVINLEIKETPTNPEPSGNVDVEEQIPEVVHHKQAADQNESIGDPVDWNQTPEALGDETQWDDEIELLD